MLVLLAVLLDRHIRDRLPPFGGIVVSHPDLEVVRQTEELPAGTPDCFGAATGEIGTGGADVGVEDGVADEDIA